MPDEWIGVLTQAHLRELGYDEPSPFLCAVFRGDGTRDVFRATNLRSLVGILKLLRIETIGLSTGSQEDRAAIWAALHNTRPADTTLQ
jgi:hypothetical protein